MIRTDDIRSATEWNHSFFPTNPPLRNQVQHLKTPSQLSGSSLKSQSIAARLLMWMTNTKLSIWATVNVFKSTRFWMLLGAPSKHTRSQIDRTINELSGSLHLSKAIHAISPAVAAWVQDRLIAMKLHESVNQFLKDEHCTFQTFVDVLLPVAYMNIAKSAKEQANSLGVEKETITLVDVVCHIYEIVNAHLPYIHARIDSIEKIADPIRRQRKLRTLFIPLVEDFLAVALPEGVKQLPLIQIPLVSQYFWKSAQKRILPTIFLEVYRQFVSPLKNSKKQQLINRSGGESLVSLAEMAGEKASIALSGILAEAHDDAISELHQFPLVGILTKGFCSLINGSEQLKQWLVGWFAVQLADFGKSDRKEIKQIWSFFGGYFEPVLIHIFTHMSDVSAPPDVIHGRSPDAIGIIIIRFFSLTSQFFCDNRPAIDARMEELKALGESPQNDPVLLDIFKPYACNLLAMMGLSDPEQLPLPDIVKNLVVQHLREIAPGFLLRQYLAIVNSRTDNRSIHKSLRNLLFDPKVLSDPKVAIDVVGAIYQANAVNLSDLFYERLWIESGTEQAALMIEDMCSVLAGTLVTSVFHHFGVEAQAKLKEEANPAMKAANCYSKELIKEALIKMFVCMAKATEEVVNSSKSRHPKELLPINMIIRLVRMVDKAFKYTETESKESRAAQNAFSNLASDLYDFGGVNPFNELPLDEFPGGEALKKLLGKSVKEAALPDWMRKFYVELASWQLQLNQSYKELEQYYHTTHPKWACRVLAQYAADYVRHYLLTSHEEAGRHLLEGLKDYFGKCIAEETSPQAERLISRNIFEAVNSEDPHLKKLWPALACYIEAILAKFLSRASKAISDIERENPDFIVDIAIQLLKDTQEHFSIIVRAAEEAGEEQAYRVNLQEMLTAFGDRLHDGVPLDSSNKDLARLRGCFIPLTAKLLELAGLSVQDLPLPVPVRQQLGESICGQLIPRILLNVYQKLLEPQVRNTLMLHFVQTLYIALNEAEAPLWKEQLEEIPRHPDQKQQHLYEICGSLVLELVKLIPDTAVQYIFMKEKVKSMSAAAIGDALMPHLSRWTLLQMIDKMIVVGLPSLHSSKWEGKQGREALIPRKAFMRPDGKMELRPVKRFKFDFAAAPAEIRAQEERQNKEAENIRKQLRDGFTRTIGQQLYIKAWTFVKSLWEHLQEQLNDFIERQFPMSGPEVKTFVDKICGKVFFDIFGAMLLFLVTPFASAAKLLIDKFVIDNRSEEVIENLQSATLENLVYQWTDTVIDTLLNLRRGKQCL